MTGAVRLLRSLVLVLIATACDKAPADLRPWRPSDHDHTSEPGNNQVVADAGVDPELAKHGLNEVALVAWEQNCVRCHGRFGRGDGPQGAMVHATDLTNPRWQSIVSDDQIRVTIRDGRGLMPAFPLPDSTVVTLVQLVRLLGQARAQAEAGPSAVPSGAPPMPSGRAPAPSARAKAAPTSSSR
jgi:mono/diheme cytochrome c family protein